MRSTTANTLTTLSKKGPLMVNHCLFDRCTLPLIWLVMLVSFTCPARAASEDAQLGDDLKAHSDLRSGVDDIAAEQLSAVALKALLSQRYGLTPAQITEAIATHNRTRNTLIDNPHPQAMTDIIPLSTAPGGLPQKIYVTPGFDTLVNIIDSTGQPWPISQVSGGNKRSLKVDSLADHRYKNVVRINALQSVGSSNISFALVDLPITLSVEIINTADKYYPTALLQLDTPGPQAKQIPLSQGQRTTVDPLLDRVLAGVKGNDQFLPMTSSDPNVLAWQYNEHLYVRTTYLPVNPFPRGIKHGASGYVAYRMHFMPVLLMTDDSGHEKRIILTQK
jgi:intracellular multiplication protein IcmK